MSKKGKIKRTVWAQFLRLRSMPWVDNTHTQRNINEASAVHILSSPNRPWQSYVAIHCKHSLFSSFCSSHFLFSARNENFTQIYCTTTESNEEELHSCRLDPLLITNSTCWVNAGYVSHTHTHLPENDQTAFFLHQSVRNYTHLWCHFSRTRLEWTLGTKSMSKSSVASFLGIFCK